MTSNDIRIVINGQEFVIDGKALRPAPASNFQQEVMKHFDSLEARVGNIEARVGNIEAGVKELGYMLDKTNSRLDMGIWFAGLCFAVFALVIAFVGIFAPKFWEHMTRKETPSQPQIDIDAIARRVGEIFGLTPKQ
ncbi:MAG: hypothetical protein IJS39_02980 [Synergistaceae bacterium]|nr:hypothetical protein [Synergistaceae bacterium]